MDLVTLAQLILLVLRNLNFKPRKHRLEAIALAIAAYLLGVQITKLRIPPSTLYYYIRKLGIKKEKDVRPRCPFCNSDRVVRNGSSRGKTKYKCKVCKRTFYSTERHRMSKEQRERILEEYLNMMSMRGIARVEGKPLTTIYSFIKRVGAKAYAELTALWGQLKSFTAESTVLDEFWTYVGVRHGERRNDRWVWVGLADGVPIFESGDRDYGTFRFLFRSLPESEVYYSDNYSVYQVLDNHVVGKEYTQSVESHNAWCRVHLARLVRETKAVNRSGRMIDYSLALLNVVHPHVFSSERTPLNEAYLMGVQHIRENLI